MKEEMMNERIAPILFFLNRPVKTIALAMAIFCATVAMISAQEAASSVPAEIRELELARFSAQQHKDNRTLDAMLDNALVWVEPDGVQLTKADYLANLRAGDVNILEIAPTATSIHVFGGIAIVVGIYYEKGMKGGKPFALRARFIDTWTLKNGKWMCIAATATSSIS
jgi:ketosteroid isomerase-like protein